MLQYRTALQYSILFINTQKSKNVHPCSKYPCSKYPCSKYPCSNYPCSKYPCSKYPGDTILYLEGFLKIKAALDTFLIMRCLKNNLNLPVKTDPVTDEIDAMVKVWVLCQTSTYSCIRSFRDVLVFMQRFIFYPMQEMPLT